MKEVVLVVAIVPRGNIDNAFDKRRTIIIPLLLRVYPCTYHYI